LARDFSVVLINFADSDHLKVDEVVPPSASRQMSETRSNTEALRLPLLASEGIAPQVLKVQFAYFAGRLPWRPILISALFLGLGNLTGPLVGALAKRLGRTLRARVHVGRGEAPGRERGAIPSQEALGQIRPGETSYEEVLRLCGPQAEEQARLPAGETRALVYRGQRVVPHRRRSFGWFATVAAASWESDSSTRLPAHQRPAGFLEVRHDVTAAPLDVASLGRHPLINSATIHIPAVEDHEVLALADKFHVVIGAWSRT